MTADRIKQMIATLEDLAQVAGAYAAGYAEGDDTGPRSPVEQDEEEGIGADLEHAQECMYNAIEGLEAAIRGIRAADARRAAIK